MEHYDWNEGWLFTPRFDPALVRPECGLELEPVRIPHTVRVLPYNYCNENEYQCLCGYRREFFAPREWAGRTVLLTFGAVAHDATVFCNGRRLFHHACGYTAFTVDLTSALHLGQKNVVAVRCDSREDLNIPPFGGQIDHLTYGGIYRAVSLDIKEPAYLRDVFVEARAEGDFRIYTATVGVPYLRKGHLTRSHNTVCSEFFHHHCTIAVCHGHLCTRMYGKSRKSLPHQPKSPHILNNDCI